MSVLWWIETWTNCKDGEPCQHWEKNVRIAQFTDRDEAFETKAECMNEARKMFQNTSSGKPHLVKRTLDGLYQDVVVVNLFSCWPAVVDIRK